MNNPCQFMRERIAEYVLGILGASQRQQVLDHVAGCPECREYLQALESQQRALAALAARVEAQMPDRRQRMIEALKQVTPMQRILPIRQYARFAAAAAVVLAVGFVGGWLLAQARANPEQMKAEVAQVVKASLEEDIRASILQEVDRRYKSAFAADCVRLKDELGQQVRRDLMTFAAQTLAASRTLADERTLELIRLIEAARFQDRQHVAAALEYLEMNRRQDKVALATTLESVALQASEGAKQVEN